MRPPYLRYLHRLSEYWLVVIFIFWSAQMRAQQSLSKQAIDQLKGALANPTATPSQNPVPQAKSPEPKNIDLQFSKPNDLLKGIIEDFTYNPNDKRDPFLPIETARSGSEVLGPQFPLQKFDLDQLKLMGVIWDVAEPKAMIMDPSGKAYIVRLNDRIGRNKGYIARIREGEIVIVEAFENVDGKVRYQTKVVKLSNEQ